MVTAYQKLFPRHPSLEKKKCEAGFSLKTLIIGNDKCFYFTILARSPALQASIFVNNQRKTTRINTTCVSLTHASAPEWERLKAHIRLLVFLEERKLVAKVNRKVYLPGKSGEDVKGRRKKKKMVNEDTHAKYSKMWSGEHLIGSLGLAGTLLWILIRSYAL